MEKFISMKKLVIILSIATVVLAGVAYYFYRNSSLFNKDQTVAQQAEVKSLVTKVGKLIVLPEDEIPTVATVSDPEKLKEQPFFTDAKKGDKVLIYTNAKKAILYDPIAHKIVTVAPINIGAEDTKTTDEGLEATQEPKQ